MFENKLAEPRGVPKMIYKVALRLNVWPRYQLAKPPWLSKSALKIEVFVEFNIYKNFVY